MKYLIWVKIQKTNFEVKTSNYNGFYDVNFLFYPSTYI